VRKKSSNLTLSNDAKKKAKELKKALHRPSTTNLVEALIVEKHQKLFPEKVDQPKAA
jgi:hypothetical protein